MDHRVKRLTVALALLLGAAQAQATVINGTLGAKIEHVSGGAIISDGSGVSFQGRTWDVPSGRTVRATDMGGPALIGGKTIELNAARTMAPLAIQKASALALKALPLVGTGIALWELWDEIRVRPDGEGGLLSDLGSNQEQVQGVEWTGKDNVKYSAASGACSSFNGTAFGYSNTYSVGVDYPPAGKYCDRVQCGTWEGATCQTQYAVITVGSSVSTINQCPASVDFYDSSKSIPAGEPVGPDGKCRRAMPFWQPIGEVDAAAKNEAGNTPDGAALKDMAQDAITRGQGIEASDRALEGPASVSGTPVSTTTTNGSGTTTTTTTNKTNYTYAGDTVTYNHTTTTNTCVGAGACATEDATETVVTETPGDTPPDPKDPCIANPTRAGCAKLGDPPTAEEMPAQTITASITPEGGFGADTGTCPAPIQTTLLGEVDPFGLVCTYMSGIRFIVIGIAWIMAALIFLGRVD